MKFHCIDYCGYNCVYGNCPNALYCDYPWATEYYENCIGCPYDYGCDDCCVPDILNCSLIECLVKRFLLEGGYIWL